jgi:hypothetical protein
MSRFQTLATYHRAYPVEGIVRFFVTLTIRTPRRRRSPLDAAVLSLLAR